MTLTQEHAAEYARQAAMDADPFAPKCGGGDSGGGSGCDAGR